MRLNWIGLILVTLIGAGCGISKQVYDGDVNRLRGQIKQLESSRMDMESHLGQSQSMHRQCTGKLRQCSRVLSALRSKGVKLDTGLKTALRRIRELEKVAAKQRAVFDQLRKALEGLIKAGKLTVSIVRGQFTVQMREKILFDSGKWKLKAEAAETLRELTLILSSVPGRQYQVAGHTDTDGPAAYNWKLSSSRSWAVVRFMIREGMAGNRISFAGYGEFQPTTDNDSPAGKAQNRRIEVVLVPDMAAFMAPFESQN